MILPWIRPLAYCKEADIIRYADHQQFPIIPCNLCGSQQNMQRQVIKEMLQAWEKQQPGRLENIFRSLQNISPSQLADNELFNFKDLELQRKTLTGNEDADYDDQHYPLAREG